MTPCEQIQVAMMRTLDQVASAEERQLLKQHLSECESCAAEFADFEATKKATDAIRESMAFDVILDQLQSGLLRKFQLNLAVTLVVAGLGIVTVFGLATALLDPHAPLAIRLGIGLAATGMVLYIIEVVRWRLRTAPGDPYEDVVR